MCTGLMAAMICLIADSDDCPVGNCTLTIPTYGLTGMYDVWMIPGSGNNFGNWTFNQFELLVADLDVLGSADVADVPALDTSAVEAPVDAPGD